MTDCDILYAKGCSVLRTDNAQISEQLMNEALVAAAEADASVIVIGDVLDQNGEAKDRANLVLSGRQIELVKRVKELGKQVIVVLVNGKPLELNEVEKYADAIIEIFNSGDRGGLAVANLIRGKENFSGKLPISFPYSSAALPCYYNQYDYWHFSKKYIDVPTGSPYPFGFGLSYSKFTYSDLTLDKIELRRGEKAQLSVQITNESAIDGEETVQLYFRDKICKLLTPVRTLLDFKKVFIPAGESGTVTFTIDTDSLGYYNRNCEYCVDAGDFDFFVSGDGKTFKEIVLKVVY